MRRFAATLLVLLSITLLASNARTEDEPKPLKAADALASMTWLAGTWQGAMWGGTFEAYYSTPEGGKILSHSRLLKDGKTAFFEFEVFEVRGDTFHYQPYPGGKKAGGFTLAECKPGEKQATFDNPKKDFPTRIVFHRKADDNLVVTLSDPHGGSDKVQTFDLKRKP